MDDFDGDGVPDEEDVCPINPQITRSDFLAFKTMIIDTDTGHGRNKPFWKVNKKVMILETKLWHLDSAYMT